MVFTTAYNEFAIHAFEANALDYLLKPIHPERLRKAVERIRERATPPLSARANLPGPAAESGGPALREGEHVFVREGERCWFVPVRSIRLLDTEGNHTRIYFEGKKPLLYRTLDAMEERLPRTLFLRANRSQLVNLTLIETISPWFSGTLKVKLRGGSRWNFPDGRPNCFASGSASKRCDYKNSGCLPLCVSD